MSNRYEQVWQFREGTSCQFLGPASIPQSDEIEFFGSPGAYRTQKRELRPSPVVGVDTGGFGLRPIGEREWSSFE